MAGLIAAGFGQFFSGCDQSFVNKDAAPHALDFSHTSGDGFGIIDGGQFLDVDRAVEHGMQMAAEGAAIIDVGGDERQIVAGIAEFYSPDELVGKRIIVVANDRANLYGDIANRIGVEVEDILNRHVNRRTGRRSTEFFESIFVWRKAD